MLQTRMIFLLCLMTALSISAAPQAVAPTPPMGWNSWDAYGLTIDEAQFRDNVKVLATLKQYGWQYAVIDYIWFNPSPGTWKNPNRRLGHPSRQYPRSGSGNRNRLRPGVETCWGRTSLSQTSKGHSLDRQA